MQKKERQSVGLFLCISGMGKQACDDASTAPRLDDEQYEDERGNAIPKNLPVVVGNKGEWGNLCIQPVVGLWLTLKNAENTYSEEGNKSDEQRKSGCVFATK